MGRTKDLMANTAIFAVSKFTSKVLGFLMVPFYTAFLTQEEFGIADLLNTTVGLLIPILSLSIANAALRYAMDQNTDNRKVFSISLNLILGGFLFLALLYPVLSLIEFIDDYVLFFYLLYLSSVLQMFFFLFVKGIDKILLVGIASIANSIILVISNVLLIYVYELGVTGYISSMIIGNGVGAVILFFGARLYSYVTFEKLDRSLIKDMLKYSAPLIPNNLSWWINQSSSRYFLNHFLGASEVGLFAAAAKMPSILNIAHNIFGQAMQISAITEHKKDGSEDYFSKVYSIYNTLMVVSCALLITFVKEISTVLYSSSFFEAWQYVPFLLISIVFGALVGFYSPFYLAEKATRKLLFSTLLGSIVTIVLNIILIPIVGIQGASISTMIAYFTVWLWLHIDSNKFLKLNINRFKHYGCYIILVIQAILTILEVPNIYAINIVLVISVMYFLIDINTLKTIMRTISNEVKNR